MEGRRGEAPLSQPEFALARQETGSEDRRDVAPEETVLDEVLTLLAQDFVDQVRMIQEIGVVRSETEVCDVAVLVRAGRQEAEDVVSEIRQVTE
jgi:hypothetical protein